MALEAARDVLLADGPQALTLKAVAARIGRTHANLLHQFGSAAGLQQALAAWCAEQICAAIGEAVLKARAGLVDPRVIVDLVFDAFDAEGGAALVAWMIASNNRAALDPIATEIHRLVLGLNDDGHYDAMRETAMTLVLLAVGDAQLGAPLASALDVPRAVMREVALRQLMGSPVALARLVALAKA